MEGAAGLSLSQPTAGQACRHSRAAVQTPHTLPLHKPHVRTTTKSDPWQKGPPHSSAFSHPKAGHSCSGTSQYLLVSPKSFLQTSYSYMEVHLSFKTTAVWSLHGKPRHVNPTCIPGTRQLQRSPRLLLLLLSIFPPLSIWV